MSYTIAKVGRRKIEYPNHVGQKFLKLSEYWDIAERTIGRFADPGLAKSMLSNEDAISHVAYHIMIGDWKFNPSIGNTNIYSYRNKCAIWAIKDYISQSKTKANQQLVSLNHTIDDKSLIDIIPDRESNSVEYIERQSEIRDNIKNIVAQSKLSKRQRECIELRYFHEMTMDEIATKLGITRQAVQQNIQRGLACLREEIKGGF